MVVNRSRTPYSRAAVEYAFEEAGLHHQPLTVVRCLPDPPGAGAGDDVLGDIGTTARTEAALGPSLLAFQRTILDNLTLELSVLHPEASVRTVLDELEVWDEFDAAVRDALPAAEPVRAARRGLAPNPTAAQTTQPPPRRRSVRNTANWLRRRTPPELS